MRKYRAEQIVCISGWSCDTEIELTMVVRFGITKYFPASDNGPAEYPQPEDINIRFFRKRDKVNVEVQLPSWIEDGFLDSDGFKSWLIGEAEEIDIQAAEQAAEDRANRSEEPA